MRLANKSMRKRRTRAKTRKQRGGESRVRKFFGLSEYSPLRTAVSEGRFEGVKALLNVQEPLKYAKMSIEDFLIQSEDADKKVRSNIREKSNTGKNLLILTIAETEKGKETCKPFNEERKKIFEYLLSKGADIDRTDDSGRNIKAHAEKCNISNEVNEIEKIVEGYYTQFMKNLYKMLEEDRDDKIQALKHKITTADLSPDENDMLRFVIQNLNYGNKPSDIKAGLKALEMSLEAN
jgi:hypothetical protein